LSGQTEWKLIAEVLVWTDRVELIAEVLVWADRVELIAEED